MKETLSYINEHLSSLYPPGELRELTRWIFEEFTAIPSYKLLLADELLTFEQRIKIFEVVNRLADNEPIQYILGKTSFCNLPFHVDKRVLIPRPETEELVRKIVDDLGVKTVNVLDIGTGSGCIAISLASLMQHADVTGMDVSLDALKVAEINAELNGVKVNFICQDILQSGVENVLGKFDCIVSNPPYVMNKEKADMDARVLNNEPHLALFVSDDDPLLFYRRIVQLGKSCLKPNGWIYFEINEQCGPQMLLLVKNEGYVNVELIVDSFGKNRMLKAQLKS